jgi:hypothetical protein
MLSKKSSGNLTTDADHERKKNCAGQYLTKIGLKGLAMVRRVVNSL